MPTLKTTLSFVPTIPFSNPFHQNGYMKSYFFYLALLFVIAATQ
jgi:hypothetical protein